MQSVMTTDTVLQWLSKAFTKLCSSLTMHAGRPIPV